LHHSTLGSRAIKKKTKVGGLLAFPGKSFEKEDSRFRKEHRETGLLLQGVSGLGSRVQNLGFKVQGLGVRVQV
jgi:hypothetical protein